MLNQKDCAAGWRVGMGEGAEANDRRLAPLPVQAAGQSVHSGNRVASVQMATFPPKLSHALHARLSARGNLVASTTTPRDRVRNQGVSGQLHEVASRLGAGLATWLPRADPRHDGTAPPFSSARFSTTIRPASTVRLVGLLSWDPWRLATRLPGGDIPAGRWKAHRRSAPTRGRHRQRIRSRGNQVATRRRRRT